MTLGRRSPHLQENAISAPLVLHAQRLAPQDAGALLGSHKQQRRGSVRGSHTHRASSNQHELLPCPAAIWSTQKYKTGEVLFWLRDMTKFQLQNLQC